MFQQWVLLGFIPFALGAVVFVFRRSLRAQLTSILLGAAIHSMLLAVFEILPQGSLGHHGNTWQGYAVVELGPFLLVLGVVAALRSFRFLQPMAAPAVVAASVPLAYWAGLAIAVSVAVTAGLVTP